MKEFELLKNEISQLTSEIRLLNSKLSNLQRLVPESTEEEEEDDASYRVLCRISWESYHLIVYLLRHGVIEDGHYVCNQEDLEKDLKITARHLRGRVVGTRRSCENEGAVPFIKISQPNPLRCALSIDAKDIIEKTLVEWKQGYQQWLDENNLKEP